MHLKSFAIFSAYANIWFYMVSQGVTLVLLAGIGLAADDQVGRPDLCECV